MVLAVFFLVSGFALFGVAAYLTFSTEDFNYFFISFGGMALFMVGGVFMGLMGRIGVKAFWENHQTNITISTNSQNSEQNTTKICPRCREENDKDALYCKKCGEKLE